MKYFGIYLGYPPTVDLRAEGLGRHLAAFLRAAAQRADVRFVVACPSWSRKSLLELCESEGVDPNGFEIVTTSGKPFILRVFEAYQRYRARPIGRKLLARLKEVMNRTALAHRNWLENQLVRSRTGWRIVPVAVYIVLISALVTPFALVLAAYRGLGQSLSALRMRVTMRAGVTGLLRRMSAILASPQDDAFVFRLYRLMDEHESESLVDAINRLSHVSAWYSPTAFWPAFNEIVAPRLMCVPDVVFTSFPVGFARLGGGDRLLDTFERVESAIRGCENLVTYSEYIKRRTLVDRFQTPADRVRVVRHAASTLDNLVKVVGFSDAETVSRNFCKVQMIGAMQRSTYPAYTNSFLNVSVPYIVYASQIRPSKNVLNLLRAYQHLLKKRLIGHKLMLTGDPDALPEVGEFVRASQLESDVIFLRRLSIVELAACYRLADLAVNPSLSEGGCPFTFTEALSVDTPVVMGRIPVTMELLDDPSLADVMFFDPYDWKDMADRMEWAIQNRTKLLAIQKAVYDVHAKRTWENVVEEYVGILDEISSPAARHERELR